MTLRSPRPNAASVASVALIMILFTVSCTCAQEAPPNKRSDGLQRVALLVGIDHYGAQHTPQVDGSAQWAALKGTVNDTNYLGAALKAQGFSVSYLHNEKATKEGILNAIKSTLLNRPNKTANDILYFHFSGHGKQIPDDDNDEADGYDETLIPFDNLGRFNGANNLRDDALGKLFDQIAAESPNLVVSLDSCHSGSATRGGPSEGVVKRGEPATDKPNCSGVCGRDKGFLESGKGKTVPYVLVSATRDVQQANEQTLNEQRMGAFTYEWVKVLNTIRPNTSFRQAHAILADRMLAYDKQNPQVEGAIDREVLGPGTVDNRNIIVTSDGAKLSFKAGGMSNLVPGTTLSVFPKSESKPNWSNPVLIAEVTGNDIASAWGRVTKGSDADKAALKNLGGVARIRTIGQDGFKVKLNLKGAPEALKESIGKDPAVVLVEPGTPGSFSFIKSDGGLILIDTFGNPQLIPGGENVSPLKSAKLPGQTKNLKWAVQRLLRRERLAYVQGAGGASSVMHVSLLGVGGDAPLADSLSRTRVRGKATSKFRVQVKNTGSQSVVAHILTFDSDGMVSVLSQKTGDGKPCPPEAESIKPGQSVIFPRCVPNYYWGSVKGNNELFVVFAPKYLDHFPSFHLGFKTIPAKRGSGHAPTSSGTTNIDWGAASIQVETN